MRYLLGVLNTSLGLWRVCKRATTLLVGDHAGASRQGLTAMQAADWLRLGCAMSIKNLSLLCMGRSSGTLLLGYMVPSVIILIWCAHARVIC
jgi:hypothetical protein